MLASLLLYYCLIVTIAGKIDTTWHTDIPWKECQSKGQNEKGETLTCHTYAISGQVDCLAFKDCDMMLISRNVSTEAKRRVIYMYLKASGTGPTTGNIIFSPDEQVVYDDNTLGPLDTIYFKMSTMTSALGDFNVAEILAVQSTPRNIHVFEKEHGVKNVQLTNDLVTQPNGRKYAIARFSLTPQVAREANETAKQNGYAMDLDVPSYMFFNLISDKKKFHRKRTPEKVLLMQAVAMTTNTSSTAVQVTSNPTWLSVGIIAAILVSVALLVVGVISYCACCQKRNSLFLDQSTIINTIVSEVQ
ncbi:hypothetical protein HDE_07877 [Halotydeus destructor]|nr:hypothetical protein HDE_07877 [Halotydeus destructor]